MWQRVTEAMECSPAEQLTIRSDSSAALRRCQQGGRAPFPAPAARGSLSRFPRLSIQSNHPSVHHHHPVVDGLLLGPGGKGNRQGREHTSQSRGAYVRVWGTRGELSRTVESGRAGRVWSASPGMMIASGTLCNLAFPTEKPSASGIPVSPSGEPHWFLLPARGVAQSSNTCSTFRRGSWHARFGRNTRQTQKGLGYHAHIDPDFLGSPSHLTWTCKISQPFLPFPVCKGWPQSSRGLFFFLSAGDDVTGNAESVSETM
ncbi:hypothetical protein L209DRAFT_16177 [Thermothelomyces heterothallicus CBS 203.75]